MPGLTDLLALYATHEEETLRKVLPLIEYSVLRNRNVLVPVWKRTEADHVADDLVEIRESMNTRDSIRYTALRSRTVSHNKTIQSYKEEPNLSIEQWSIIETEVLKQYEHYLTYAFLLEAVRRDRAADRIKWTGTALLGVIAASLGVIVTELVK